MLFEIVSNWLSLVDACVFVVIVVAVRRHFSLFDCIVVGCALVMLVLMLCVGCCCCVCLIVGISSCLLFLSFVDC